MLAAGWGLERWQEVVKPPCQYHLTMQPLVSRGSGYQRCGGPDKAGQEENYESVSVSIRLLSGSTVHFPLPIWFRSSVQVQGLQDCYNLNLYLYLTHPEAWGMLAFCMCMPPSHSQSCLVQHYLWLFLYYHATPLSREVVTAIIHCPLCIDFLAVYFPPQGRPRINWLAYGLCNSISHSGE